MRCQKRPVFNNSISGTVQNRDGNGLSATVLAYRIAASNNTANYWSTRTAQTDAATGAYSFSNLSTGDYVLMAYSRWSNSPNDTLNWYLPGYYKEGADAVSDWFEATRISVDENTNTSGRTITLLTAAQKNGTGRIRGTVAEGAGRTIKQGPQLGGAKPIAGALVTAKTAEGEPVGAAYTNQNGEFEISGLPNGTMKLTISRVGYGAKNVEVNVEDGKAVDLPVDMKQSGTSGVETEMANTARLAVVPNPVTGNARLSFVANGTAANLTVLSLDGRVVMEQTISTVAGANSTAIDLAGVASGMYVVTLRTSNGVSATKLTVAR
ncbi:MAG: TonB-dependent receptor [Chlorobi bacterium OLB7]|nr:MAG: TonB-dependent receptor [Chlorobi bacterium OLB7]